MQGDDAHIVPLLPLNVANFVNRGIISSLSRRVKRQLGLFRVFKIGGLLCNQLYGLKRQIY